MPEKAFSVCIKVSVFIDPACGSGAFPIGMLQKIVYILQEIDPGADLWFDEIVKEAPIYVRKAFEKKFQNGELDYLRKLTVIEKSIFGVDIQPIAVEISRLRCFLSLVIEEKVDDNAENRGIRALPNLDFKFIIANTLVSLPNDSDSNRAITDAQLSIFERQDHISQLKAVREEFFGASDAETKSELKLAFSEIQKEMFQEALDNRKMASARYQALFQWAPFDNKVSKWFDMEWMFGVKEGFNIIIGNPPYGVSFSNLEKQFLSFKYPTVPDYESADYFVERSYELLANNSILCFIIPNMFLANQFAKKFRKAFIEKWGICQINNLSQSSVFESASVRNAIVLLGTDKTNYGRYSNMQVTESGVSITQSIQITQDLLKDSIDNWLNLLDVDETTRTLIRKIRTQTVPLSSLCSISQGLIPYDKYRGHSEETIKNKIWNATYQKDSSFRKELQGKDVSRYSLDWNGSDWLSYGSWLAAPRKPEFFTQPRILIREITNPRIMATYTDEEYYNTPSIINCISFQEIHPYYALGLLNSSLMSFYHIKTSPKAGKGLFPKILVSDVRKIPIRVNQVFQDQIVTIVGQLLVTYSSDLDKQLDQLVYQIYGLSKEEISVIEESIR